MINSNNTAGWRLVHDDVNLILLGYFETNCTTTSKHTIEAYETKELADARIAELGLIVPAVEETIEEF